MFIWFVFLISIFWILLLIVFFQKIDIIELIIISDIIWVTLYIISIFCGSLLGDINVTSLSFFILGLAGLEFSIGIIIIIFYKNINFSLNLNSNTKNDLDFNFFKKIKNPVDKFF